MVLGQEDGRRQGRRRITDVDRAGAAGHDAVTASAAFIVRAWRDVTGHLTGVVERATTGEKARFQGAAALVEVIERMLVKPRTPPPDHMPEG